MQPVLFSLEHERRREAERSSFRQLMSDDLKAVHVSATGENWEVESNAGTLAQAETKQEAIEAARDLAADVQAEEIVVHTSDGMVEARLPVQASPPLPHDPIPFGDREP